MKRFILVVIDGLGIGAQEDAAEYGDEGANTIGKVSEISNCKLPNFEKLGLGNIEPLHSIREVENPAGSYGKMREVSSGKDSTTGHWELAGIHLEKPFATFPDGFPDSVVQKFCELAGVEGVLCNKPYSGTDVIRDYGVEHIKTGKPILYTSADSVFQIACHKGVTSLEKLYEWCEMARKKVVVGENEVGRVIARPFEGEPGNFTRVSDERKDYSAIPPEPNMLTLLQGNNIKTYSIGKVIDLFAGIGFTQYRKTNNNAEGVSQLLSLMSAEIENSFVFANLIDTDQIYGHRQDPEGFGECLEEIDRALPSIIQKLKKGDIIAFTGDHGNDPADDSTDHTREFVPLIVYAAGSENSADLGVRGTFSDISASVLHYFNVENDLPGQSFVEDVN